MAPNLLSGGALSMARFGRRDTGLVTMTEGPETESEMSLISERFGDDWPLVQNLVEGGNSPIHSAAALGKLGYAIALHPLLLLHGFIRRAPALLAELIATGSTTALSYQIADLHEFNALLARQELKRKFA